MSSLLDSSVLIAAIAPEEPKHQECLALLMRADNVILAHACLETFSTLTGGRLGIRVDADFAARLLSETILPRVRVIELGVEDRMRALRTARKHGVRGGAVYDFMHLIAARKAGVATFHTLNFDDFQGLRREGDPEIVCP